MATIWRASEVASDQLAPTGHQAAPDQIFTPGRPFSLKRPLFPQPRHRPQPGQGRRSQTTASHPRNARQTGHYIRATLPHGRPHDIAIAATLRASAFSKTTCSPTPPLPNSSTPQLPITPADLRVKLRRARAGHLILFLVDASGSMGARKRMVAVKGAVLSLLLDAYQKRDRVGLIMFRGEGAQVLVPPTNSVELAERRLRHMPTGGRTPLAAGLQLAHQTLTSYLQRDSALTPFLVIISDGRANTGDQAHLRQTALKLAKERLATLLLDSEPGLVRLGLGPELADWLGAHYLPLDELRAEAIAGQVRSWI